jgi:prepilin-type processing-associated H-X9-DG protein
MLLATMLYANENNGNLPDNLDQLKTHTGGQLPPNPRGQTDKPDFVYIKPAAMMKDLANPASIVVLHENLEDLEPQAARISVGFADGHVETMPRERLGQLLEAQKK